MINREQVEEVRNKFKATFWRPTKEKFNAIIIDQHIHVNEVDELMVDAEIVEGDFFLKVFLFDMKDAEQLPTEIDGVEIKYVPTFPKKEPDIDI